MVEFVSANPTGPLHVGHCRGAILGDVISNVLLFNNHKVTKEYYVNDYGNQIINFTKSVYFRIREVKFGEIFPNDNPDLYPGDYLIDFANNIITSNTDLNYDTYEGISEKLTALSIEQALLLIKRNLKSLGINHDSFVSEKKIVLNKEVESVVSFLETNNFVYKGKIKAPAGEDKKDWKVPYWLTDAAFATMALQLLAIEVELETCFIGLFDREERIKEYFSIPESYEALGVLIMGYPDTQKVTLGRSQKRKRRPLNEVVHRGVGDFRCEKF